MYFDGPDLAFGLGPIIFSIVGGLLSFASFLLIAALLFLLVRFLLVATKAAQIYVAKHTPPAPERSTEPATRPRPATPESARATLPVIRVVASPPPPPPRTVVPPAPAPTPDAPGPAVAKPVKTTPKRRTPKSPPAPG
jgi:hypothetical protein